MGFYALAGLESDRQLRGAVRQYMIADINKRREYIRSITMSGGSKYFSHYFFLVYIYIFFLQLQLELFKTHKIVDKILF